MQKLEELDYSVITLHVTGAGSLAMERLIREGHFVGVLDVTTIELVDKPSPQCLSHSGLLVEQPSSMQSLPQDKRQLTLELLSRTEERTFVVFCGSRFLSIIVLSGEFSAGIPSDICAGAFGPDKEVIGLLPRLPVLKLSVTGLSERGNAEGAGGLFEASSTYFPVSWCERTEQIAGTPFFLFSFSLVGPVEA
jgi:hypothetical protein